MSNDRWARYGAASGIVFVILLVVGFLVVTPKPPDADASGQAFASYFTDHQDAIRIGLTLVGAGLFFWIWFLGSLRSALAGAEGGTGRLASIAYAGGILAGGFLLLAVTAVATAAYRPDQVDPNITRALNDLSLMCGGAATGAFLALFAAAAIAGYRYRPFSPTVAGLSALAAIAQLGTFGVVFTDSGAFAPDGALGLVVPVVGFIVGVVALSVALVRNPQPGPAAQ
jgi:hypothetical protein